MTTDRKNEQVFEEYLQGDSELSRRYRESKAVEPPKHLDDDILAAAKGAVNKPDANVSRLVPRNWYRPVSKVALLLICVSLLFTLYETVEKQSSMVISDSVVPDPEPSRSLDNGSRAVDMVRDTVREKKTGETAGGEAASTPLQAPAPSMEEEMAPGVAAKRMIQREEVYSEPDEKKKMESRQAIPSAGATAGQGRSASKMEGEHMVQDAAPLTRRESVSVKTEQEWLEQISGLWQAGKKKEAITGLQKFTETYPDYPHAKIRKMLPGDFEPSLYIRGFEIE